jgi:hypothetical protein
MIVRRCNRKRFRALFYAHIEQEDTGRASRAQTGSVVCVSQIIVLFIGDDVLSRVG